jgi:hypothetical protein
VPDILGPGLRLVFSKARPPPTPAHSVGCQYTDRYGCGSGFRMAQPCGLAAHSEIPGPTEPHSGPPKRPRNHTGLRRTRPQCRQVHGEGHESRSPSPPSRARRWSRRPPTRRPGHRYRAQLEQLSGLFQSFSQADASISRRFGDSRDRASRCAAVSSSEGFLAGRQGASRVNRRSAGCWLDSSTPSLLELTANEVQSGRCVSGVSASRVESCPINHGPPIAVTAYLFGLSVPVACRPLPHMLDKLGVTGSSPVPPTPPGRRFFRDRGLVGVSVGTPR